MCGVWRRKKHAVAGGSANGDKVGKCAKETVKKALESMFQGLKLVAGAGFEPATFRL